MCAQARTACLDDMYYTCAWCVVGERIVVQRLVVAWLANAFRMRCAWNSAQSMLALWDSDLHWTCCCLEHAPTWRDVMRRIVGNYQTRNHREHID